MPENPEAAAMAVAIQRPSVKDQSIGVTSTLDILFINKFEIEVQRQTARLSLNFGEEVTDFSDMSSIMNEKTFKEVDV